MPADMFTKALIRVKLNKFSKYVGLSQTVRNMVFFELFLCYFSRLSMLFYPSLHTFPSVSLFKKRQYVCY